LLLIGALVLGCAHRDDGAGGVVVTLAGSGVGAEGAVLRQQVARFERAHPAVRVSLLTTPDAADQRHQLFVQWLNAHSDIPDVLQVDVIWTPELAAAGWLLPLDGFAPDVERFFPRTIAADRFAGRLFALPWFVDVGVLYLRTDLVDHPPRSLDEMDQMATAAAPPGVSGLVWNAARYEGLVTVFLEYLGAFGGRMLDEDGRPAVDSPAGQRALARMEAEMERGIVPRAALSWQEEQVRFAFQNGRALFMRNWPYAASLMRDPVTSRVAGHFAVAPLPFPATLGGQQLAINARSRHAKEAWALVEFLTAPDQLRERAQLLGELPPRPALYDAALARALPLAPDETRRAVDTAVPRPASPVYAQLSDVLQIQLHAVLSRQETAPVALARAAQQMRTVLQDAGLARGATAPPTPARWPFAVAVALALAALSLAARRWRARVHEPSPDRWLARALVAPTLLALGVVALFPLGWTVWESLHRDDLHTPWRARAFVGLGNYRVAIAEGRFWRAMGHTLAFVSASVTLELLLGLAFALALHRAFHGRGAARAGALTPWAMPTVVAALLWRFLFGAEWLVDPTRAWIPIVVADVWKSTPFVTLLLLAGLQSIDPALYQAARVDGAGPFRQLVYITLPLLKSAALVALLFRTIDALRVFDLIYVLTGGGPGTATEPIAMYTFSTELGDLRFGYGAALCVILFLLTLSLALIYVRLLGRELTGERR
jgi:multiple sugar transport system substrate-binding protein